ncbi:MAG: hypothetical protein AABY64_13795 [Bdellovibrionota bacterium]
MGRVIAFSEFTSYMKDFSKELKDVVVPDSVAKKYRSYHFD